MATKRRQKAALGGWSHPREICLPVHGRYHLTMGQAPQAIKKLPQEFYGPFKILRQLGPVSFELMLPPQSHIHPVFHAHLLKASNGPGTAIDRASSLPNAADADEYTVESLVDVRGIQGKERYLVKWPGYPYEECTWEPTTCTLHGTEVSRSTNMCTHTKFSM